MVINDRNRFIFVHIPKTAGSSIMAALAELPGNNLRWLAETKHEPLAAFRTAWRTRRDWRDRLLFRTPRRYWTFAFVRNPWDRVSSYYRYLKEQRPTERADEVHSFADFLEMAADGVPWIRERHAMRPQTDFFTLVDRRDARLSVNFLGHYEHLIEDLETITKRLSIAIKLPQTNASSNARSDYREQFTPRMIDQVTKLYGAEARLFGYTPDLRAPQQRVSGPIDVPPPKTL